MNMRLVDRGKPRRLSGAEIRALVAERLAIRKAHTEANSEASKVAQDEWRARQARREVRKLWGHLGLSASLGITALCTASSHFWVSLLCIGAACALAMWTAFRPGHAPKEYQGQVRGRR